MSIMIKTILVVILAVVAAPAVFAQEVSFGTFNAEGYNAYYVATRVGETSLYWEHEFEIDYDLVIAQHPLSKDISLVARYEDPDWLRVGLKFALGSGSSRVTVVALPGQGDAPSWVDVFTPSLKLCDYVNLDGWLRFREGDKPAIWVGPTIKVARFGLWFRSDMNGGTWLGGVDLPSLKF